MVTGLRAAVVELTAAALCITLLAACATPLERQEARLRAGGYDKLLVEGTRFLHVLYADSPGTPTPFLHVYIEHDGQPWTAGGRLPSSDPTPNRPVMLGLMQRDPSPRVYLGRPCYWGLQNSRHCNALAWTHQRYAEVVVESMAAALRREMARRGAQQVYLFGHSGGGTLAVLLAYRMPEARAVVTLAGNLDVSRWAELHGYSPLQGSLDPAVLPALPAGITQVHHVGDADLNVPAAFAASYAQTHAGAQVVRHAGVDHLCCWPAIWPDLLAAMKARVAPPQ